jgi:ATP-dependent DNA helicase RecG
MAVTAPEATDDLAEAMGSLGYVQKFGAGLPIARRILTENGNPPPAFNPDSSYVSVVVREAIWLHQ